MSKLKPCTACNRHVRRHEATCPFCGTPLQQGAPFRAGLAVMSLAVPLALAACDKKEEPKADDDKADAEPKTTDEANAPEEVDPPKSTTDEAEEQDSTDPEPEPNTTAEPDEPDPVEPAVDDPGENKRAKTKYGAPPRPDDEKIEPEMKTMYGAPPEDLKRPE